MGKNKTERQDAQRDFCLPPKYQNTRKQQPPDRVEEYIKYSISLKLRDESRQQNVALLSSRFKRQCQAPVALSMLPRAGFLHPPWQAGLKSTLLTSCGGTAPALPPWSPTLLPKSIYKHSLNDTRQNWGINTNSCVFLLCRAKQP